MQDAIFSKMVKSGGTIFIDLKMAKNDKKYLTVTQTSKDEGGNQKRMTVRVWSDAIEEFASAIREAADQAKD